MLTQRERASIEFIRAHLLELQSMARLSRQNVLGYLIEMAAMEANELLSQYPQKKKALENQIDKATGRQRKQG